MGAVSLGKSGSVFIWVGEASCEFVTLLLLTVWVCDLFKDLTDFLIFLMKLSISRIGSRSS